MHASTHRDLSDDELISRYRKSADNIWLGYLLDRYCLLLLGVAMKYLKDRSLAEDAVQQVFLKTLTHFPKEAINNFKGWLYILMRNHCLQALRGKTYTVSDDQLGDIGNTDQEIEQKRLEEYTLAQMDDAIAALAPEQQQVIILFYLKKQSYEQISKTTGYNFMQVKSYIQNGKRNLKTILQKRISNLK